MMTRTWLGGLVRPREVVCKVTHGRYLSALQAANVHDTLAPALIQNKHQTLVQYGCKTLYFRTPYKLQPSFAMLYSVKRNNSSYEFGLCICLLLTSPELSKQSRRGNTRVRRLSSFHLGETSDFHG